MPDTSSSHPVNAATGPAAATAAPSTIGDYRVLRRIGEGGMGTVFEAEQQEPRRRVALKVLRQPLAMSEDAVGLFRRETQALARLRHPAIATIHESGTTRDGLRFFAMELVPGVSLADWLSARPITKDTSASVIARRLDIFRQICGGASYAHLRGVIHRDLKPSNIMVRAEPSARVSTTQVKILDFGLALIQDAETSTGVCTDPGTIRGTVAYMSPEQTGGPNEVDTRTDVY